MNGKLTSIAAQAADELTTKLHDSEEKLLTAIADHVAANQDSDKPVVFNIGFSIKLDWDGNKAVYTLSFSTKYKAESICELPDQNQPELFREPDEDAAHSE